MAKTGSGASALRWVGFLDGFTGLFRDVDIAQFTAVASVARYGTGVGESDTVTMFVEPIGMADSVAAVPEPSTLLLTGVGIGLYGWRAKSAGIRR